MPRSPIHRSRPLHTLYPRFLRRPGGLPALALAIAMAVAHPAAPAQGQQPGDEEAVLAVITTMFDGMRARDGEMIRSAFHPDARLLATGMGPDGVPRVQIIPISDFIQQVGQPGPSLDEQIFNPKVEIDGGLAQVWVDYTLHVGEDFSHCGVDSFQLARTAEGWKILSVADTRRQEGCEVLLR